VPAPVPDDDETLRQRALGEHLLNDARTFAHGGERERARELYRTIVERFPAVQGPIARTELSQLEKGNLASIPSPSKERTSAGKSRHPVAGAEPGKPTKPDTPARAAGRAAAAAATPQTPPAARSAREPVAPGETEPSPGAGTPVPAPDAASVLRTAGMRITKGAWVVTSDGTFTGEPQGDHRVCTLCMERARFKTLSVEIRGTGSGAGFSFGKGQRFLSKPGEAWQRLSIEIDAGDRVIFKVGGRRVSASRAAVYGDQLPDRFYLRGQEGRVSFRNLTIDGRTLPLRFPKSAAAPGTSARTTPKEPGKAEAEPMTEWEVVAGAWSRSGGVLTGRHAEGRGLISIKRTVKPFRRISVSLRGDGGAAGVSFGKGRRFLVRPTAHWQKLALEVLADGTIAMRVDGVSRHSLEEVVGSDTRGTTLYLRAEGSRVEFRDFKMEPAGSSD
jgi:hypothetical protein